MRICIDLDKTICHSKKSGENYSDVLPIDGAVQSIQKLKQEGYYIIIATARNMLTLNNNLGAITAKQGKIIMDWLEKYQIPYDELWLGKPLYHVVIDDRAIHFTSWNNALEELSKREEDF